MINRELVLQTWEDLRLTVMSDKQNNEYEFKLKKEEINQLKNLRDSYRQREGENKQDLASIRDKLQHSLNACKQIESRPDLVSVRIISAQSPVEWAINYITTLLGDGNSNAGTNTSSSSNTSGTIEEVD